jgi:hypothetical protein
MQSKLATVLFLAACGASSSEAPDTGPDASTAQPDAPPQPNDPPAGCVWNAVPISGTPISPTSELAFAVSPAGERAVVYTANVAQKHDVVVARGTNGFQTQAWGLNLIAGTFDDLGAAYTATGALRIAYSNEGANNNGGVYWAPQPGQSFLVDGIGLVGRSYSTDLVIGADGVPHIAYLIMQPTDHRLVVADVRPNNTFDIAAALVDNELIGEANVAVDAGGRVHATIRDENPSSIVYAVRTGTTWSTPSMVSTGGAIAGAHLAVGATNTVHAARFDTNRIIVAHGTHGSWQVTNLAQAQTSLANRTITAKAVAVDPNGGVHLVSADMTGALIYEKIGEQPRLVVQNQGAIKDVKIAFGPTGPQFAWLANNSTLYASRCD